MKTKILLISVNEDDPRKICEGVEDMTFSNEVELGDKLKELGFNGYAGIMELTNFMFACNYDEKWLHGYIISYVHFKTDHL